MFFRARATSYRGAFARLCRRKLRRPLDTSGDPLSGTVLLHGLYRRLAARPFIGHPRAGMRLGRNMRSDRVPADSSVSIALFGDEEQWVLRSSGTATRST